MTFKVARHIDPLDFDWKIAMHPWEELGYTAENRRYVAARLRRLERRNYDRHDPPDERLSSIQWMTRLDRAKSSIEFPGHLANLIDPRTCVIESGGVCSVCGESGLDDSDNYCRNCGAMIVEECDGIH